VRWLCTAVLLAVIFQGVLGGLRVVLVKLGLAVIHGCFAQAFFCLAAFAALVTSRGWGRTSEGGAATVQPTAVRFARLAVLATVLIDLQLIVGALMRHDDAGLAIPDLPLHYGRIVPPTDDAGLHAANLWRARSGEPELRPVTLGQIWLHFGHRSGAVLVTLVLAVLVARAARRKESGTSFKGSAALLGVLLLLQLTLGVLTVLLRKPADIASLHVAVGALVLVTTFLIAVRALRICGAFKNLETEARGFTPTMISGGALGDRDLVRDRTKDPGLREYPQTRAWHA
jgi:cytochrome c oxidase assembly protein subunit 15